MSTKSYVFKPDANTLLPLMSDPKITISTVPILQTTVALRYEYVIFYVVSSASSAEIRCRTNTGVDAAGRCTADL